MAPPAHVPRLVRPFGCDEFTGQASGLRHTKTGWILVGRGQAFVARHFDLGLFRRNSLTQSVTSQNWP